MAKRQPKISEEEQQQRNMDGELRRIRENLVYGILPKNPTRTFSVGERVQWGAMNETYVREVFENGLYYTIESIGVVRERDGVPKNEKRYMEWHELFKYNQTKPTTFGQPEKYYLRMLNSGLSSLIHMVHYSGVDFDVDYQRDHVWTLDDKVALIDSIFNNIDIGKFVFAQRSMGVDGKLYEIIDGKQRLTAICEFIEGRFQYKGMCYADLSNKDKHHILSHQISYGYLENPTKRAVYETFIKLNTTGRPMKNEDINKVKKLLNDLH